MVHAAIVAAFAMAVLLGLPAPAHTQVDMLWNDCGFLGLSNKNFACAGTSVQTYPLVVTFTPPVSLPSSTHMLAYIGLANAVADSLAPFWHYETGGCQRAGTSGLAVSNNFTLLPLCESAGYSDPWGFGADGAPSFFYQANFPSPAHGIFQVFIQRLSGSFPIIAGTPYYAFHLNFNNRHRADCAGCAQQVALKILDLYIASDDGTETLHLKGPDQLSDCATINTPISTLCDQVVGVSKEPRAARRLVMHAPRPNPTTGSVSIVYELPALQRVTAEVFDVRGRRVRALAQDEMVSPGLHTLSWNGKDARGAKLPSGMYLVSVRAGSHHGVRKVALLP